MTKTHASVLSEGITDCGWNQDTQKLLCLDYISDFLGKGGVNNFHSFLFDIANNEIVYDTEGAHDSIALIDLYIHDAEKLNHDESPTLNVKYTSPEEIQDAISDITGWNESTKLQLVCRFLDKRYYDKIEHFETMIQQIIADESTEHSI